MAERSRLGRSAGGASRAGRVPSSESRGVLAQDRRLELAELRARLEAELIGERAAGRPVGAQGVGLASGAVEASMSCARRRSR